uniref:Uncharacterized protein n=1 Tax=Arundo donax TaxID=35708 RepID=A0A0A8YNE7_ARUDO
MNESMQKDPMTRTSRKEH